MTYLKTQKAKKQTCLQKAINKRGCINLKPPTASLI